MISFLNDMREIFHRDTVIDGFAIGAFVAMVIVVSAIGSGSI